jgi:hypothetical protein
VENCRQLVTRARKHISDERRTPVNAAEQSRLLTTFIAAAQKGDVAALENLFATGVVSHADGGGVVRAARILVVGRERVAKLVASFSSHFWTGMTVTPVEANGKPALLITRDGAPAGLVTIDASADGVEQILWFMRPSKLAALSRPGRAARASSA